MKRWPYWCIGLGLVTAVGALLWFGVRPWTLAFALFMLVCPGVIAWGALQMRRSPDRGAWIRSLKTRATQRPED